ncbi:MAG: hypothetical protein JWN10_718 [Solirubrobacterales bacterium]|nr:hypothetical protein [Solirubrobacterales bacterium]
MSQDPRFEQDETEDAAREAAGIGGVAGDEDLDPAERAVVEAGGGESEGFDQAEQLLIEHASHTDEQSAHWILRHQGRPEETGGADDEDAADHERSSEVEDDDG